MREKDLFTSKHIVNNFTKHISTGDTKVIEEAFEDILEVGLFALTGMQPNFFFIIFFLIIPPLVVSAETLVSREVITEEEAILRVRDICTKFVRLYGKVVFLRIRKC